jgi:signal transduction histidine kinase
MSRTMTMISLLGAGLAFAAACATLALMGLGVPMLLAALAAAAAAGLVLHAVLLAQIARPMAALQGQVDDGASSAAAMAARLSDVETRAASMRHDLRGVLSPALMVTDRLINNPEPTVQRAGQAVIRSIERATAIIQASKPEPAEAAPAPSTEPADPAAG